MKTLPNYFQTNLNPFRETIIKTVCLQTLPPTASRPDPQGLATDAFQQDWKYQFLYAFP